MPPIPPIDNQVALDEQLSLSDQDVDILHQIILRAEEQPDVETLPFRAIFAAYDAVLSEHGIEAERDQVYLRVLFQLGDRRLHGDGLYGRFEALLAHMGIQLEYADGNATTDGENYGDYSVQEVEGRDAGGGLQMLPNGGTTAKQRGGGGRQRRASFNSMYDAANETTRSIYRPSSRSSVSRLEVGTRHESSSPDRRPTTPYFPERRLSADALQEAGRGLAMLNGLSQRENHNLRGREPTIQSPHVREHIVKPFKSRLPIRQTRPPSDSSGEDSVEPAEPESADDYEIEKHHPPAELLYQPSLPNLLRDAQTFDMYRQQAAIRQVFARWAERAVQKRILYNNNMEKVAIQHDAKILLRQALEIWRVVFQTKRQEAQTERFFAHLEERAARARDLYLLTKAFTHWAQVTSEEVERTSAARQHILCIKYFNAWREITAVNELKVQRFVLKKPFNLWRAKLRQIARNEEHVPVLYRKNLVKNAYWQWFWSFCDRRAPEWRDYRLKHRSLIAWLRELRTRREREQEIDLNNRHTLLQSTFQKWAQRTRDILVAEQQADSRWMCKIARDNVTEWHAEAKLRPVAIQVSRHVDKRILRGAANVWSLRARMEKQAREVDRLRVMRNAWTSWNDRLRWQALSARIDTRVVTQTLYKWVLLERTLLMTRIREQRLKGEMMHRLLLNPRTLYTDLLHRERDFRDHRTRELLRSKLGHWHQKLVVQRQRERVALEFYAPRVEQESLEIWRTRMRYVNSLESWVQDARYYFLASKTIKQWRAATVESSKRRRQDAYAAVRRRVKVNSAVQALTNWRLRVDYITAMENRAADLHRNKVSKKGIEVFDRWRQQSARRVQTLRDAEIYYNRQLAYNNLTHLFTTFTKYRAQESKAAQFLDIHVSGVAMTQFRKLSLRAFQIRASVETAEAMQERNLRKHFRNMFRHWLGKVRMGGGLLSGAPARNGHGASMMGTSTAALGSSSRPTNQYDTNASVSAGGGEGGGGGEWPGPDTTLQLGDLNLRPGLDTYYGSTTPRTPAPTPGYLNSPSKRAARAKALSQLSTTPATPLRTPFAARLMAERATDPSRLRLPPPLSGLRRGMYGRSVLATNVRFALDEEVEEEEGEEGDDEGEEEEGHPESPSDGRMGSRSSRT
ncbi:hypothetical protein AJ80_08126 [Polytolypa hystricis UAMH7299]|uniref:Sfi1 spindle body domain-containing protein n=1 Tax=Polytolypa hystricis (strain UAMH7299) TaxID=1447883 RepID=A0A2B7XCQ8_POLH7|nr:hypothetical protein AJ80_08126 [Polytolypa hystricis UAMH7299]